MRNNNFRNVSEIYSSKGIRKRGGAMFLIICLYHFLIGFVEICWVFRVITIIYTSPVSISYVRLSVSVKMQSCFSSILLSNIIFKGNHTFMSRKIKNTHIYICRRLRVINSLILWTAIDSHEKFVMTLKLTSSYISIIFVISYKFNVYPFANILYSFYQISCYL